MGKLFEELKRRKVVRVAVVYAVAAWLIVQIVGAIASPLSLPDWFDTFAIIQLVIGFPIAIILAWAYDVTPDGIRTDTVVQQPQVINQGSDRKLNYAILVLVLLAVGFQVTDRFFAPSQQSTGDQSVSENTETLRDAATLASPENRFDIVTPATDFPNDFALSPDGRQIVFVASDGSGVSQLWLRSLATTTAQPLAGTEGALLPFWSPDSRSIGFFDGTALKRLDVGGGTVQTLPTLSVALAWGATWGADSTILYVPNAASGLMRISATGGETTAATTLEPGQTGHRAPSFLPDGRRFLYLAVGTPDASGIYLGDLAGTAPVRLTAAQSAGVFHPDGWLLWVRAGTLTAQRLDLAQATLTGEPLTFADGVSENGVLSLSTLSVASTGLIAYRTGESLQRQLTWFDRTGTVLGTFGELDSTMGVPQLSPDGRRVAVNSTIEGNQDIWLLDGARNSRFTFDSASDQYPVWSPDGSRIVFSSVRTGLLDLYQKPSNGAGEETLLLSSEQIKVPTSWSADGRFLLYYSISPQMARDLWALPMTGDPVPFIVLQTPFDERFGAFSPDGGWVAYQSNESGRNEIYVRAFVAPVDTDSSAATAMGGVWQVSTAGGIHPIWSPDGQELYYLDPAGNMLSAPLTAAEDALEVGAPIELFPTRIVGGGVETSTSKQYDMAADGRFLINTVVGEASTTPITLIQNWNPEATQ